MAQPTPYTRQVGFTLYSAQNPADPIRGSDLDIEFNAIRGSFDETLANLALIQDDDGALKTASVGRRQLDSSITLGFGPPANWASDTTYTADYSTVFHNSIFYQCVVTHVSGATFDADNWVAVADFSAITVLDDNSLSGDKLVDASITSAKYGANSVDTTAIASNSVTTAKILDANVTTAKIADGSVTVDKVAGSVWSTGDVKLTLKNVADSGWLMMNDSTIGSAASGATYANADAQDLFTLLFDNILDAHSALLTSAGSATTRAAQTNAATAWAANCRITLTKVVGRALAVAGFGTGPTTFALGQTAGAETHSIAQAELPNIVPTFTGAAQTVVLNSLSGKSIPYQSGFVIAKQAASIDPGGPQVPGVANAGDWAGKTSPDVTFTPGGTISSINGGVTQTATSLMQPTAFLNIMIKL